MKIPDCKSSIQLNEKAIFCQKDSHSAKLQHHATRLDDTGTYPITITWE